jgi:hypothetical protein
MRRRAEIAGYVVTELTVRHRESYGLFDTLSNPRTFHHDLHKVNGDSAIVPPQPGFQSGGSLHRRDDALRSCGTPSDRFASARSFAPAPWRKTPERRCACGRSSLSALAGLRRVFRALND